MPKVYYRLSKNAQYAIGADQSFGTPSSNAFQVTDGMKSLGLKFSNFGWVRNGATRGNSGSPGKSRVNSRWKMA